MRKKFAVLAVVVLGALASVTAAQAGNTTITNTTSPINLLLVVPCANGGAGEFVFLSGEIHSIVKLTINGNRFNLEEHINFQGVSGTGLTTGDKYQGTDTFNHSDNDSLNNLQHVETITSSFRVTGQGPGNNFVAREVAHITFNANGDVTVFFDNFSADCG